MTAKGVTRIEHLRAHSVRASNGTCWVWQGAATEGVPCIWTFDHDRGEKRVMSGPAAVWNIAFGRGTGGGLAYRCCGTRGCVNPVHVRLAPDRAAMFAALKRDGRFKGTHVEARRATILLAHAANGVTPTAPEVVRAIRAADAAQTCTALGVLYGIHHSTVSNIRRGKSHRLVMDEAVAVT